MRASIFLNSLLALIITIANASTTQSVPQDDLIRRADKISPKFMIISMFAPEAEVWYGIPEFNLLEHNITIPGLSPLFPQMHCTKDGEICQIVTGESEINAASTISALVLSTHFKLTKTYFMVGGIAGINPERATLGSVTFARYTVQVALQYEFDAREKPSNFSTGYFAQGSYAPGQYPGSIYGTEVFEVNDALRNVAVSFAKTARLNDSADAAAYRANYATNPAYAPGAAPPSIVQCDSATSDVYYSGALLAEAFSNYSTLITNGSAIYCSTAQEDNATLEALLRGASAGLVDFTRIILMRTGSDFDRPYPGEDAVTNLLYANQGGFDPAVLNIYLAGVKVVTGIVSGWKETFETGVAPGNYVGDVLDTLGDAIAPDFGLPSQFLGATGGEMERRGTMGQERVRRIGGKRAVGPRMALRVPGG